jgi:hypothetical protein
VTPHVFFVSAGNSDADAWDFPSLSRPPPTPPQGWAAKHVCLTHCEAGGATSGRWSVSVWYPPGCPNATPIPIIPCPWFPLRVFVKDRLAVIPVRADEVPVDLPPVSSVIRSGSVPRLPGSRPDGLIQHWGHFPSSTINATVLLKASGSPTGWGKCCRSPLELAVLWDVPISVSDRSRSLGIWTSSGGFALLPQPRSSSLEQTLY